MELGDRLALLASNDTTNVLMTARVDRDAALKIVGLSDLVVVDNGVSVGSIDYSPYENSIVTSINADLWLIHLAADNTFLSSEQLIESLGFAEINPAWAPDGALIAFTRGQFRGTGPGFSDPDIYTFDVASSSVARVTNRKNAGNASWPDQAMWSPDSESIGFFAFAKARMPRNSPCSGLVNTEIFLIPADGSATATQITNTNGTSAEYRPAWGW
jgi:Tol biopolymer transport system component